VQYHPDKQTGKSQAEQQAAEVSAIVSSMRLGFGRGNVRRKQKKHAWIKFQL
jgi:hypothetical protein